MPSASFPEADYFDAVVTADAFERLKPAPDAFLAAASAVGADPRNCVVIEDAPAGVAAARAAGMRVLEFAPRSRGSRWRQRGPMPSEGHERGDRGGADGAGGFHGRRGGVRAWSWRGGSGEGVVVAREFFLKFFKIIFPLFCSRFFVSALSPHRNCFRMQKREREEKERDSGLSFNFFVVFSSKTDLQKKTFFFPLSSLSHPIHPRKFFATDFITK